MSAGSTTARRAATHVALLAGAAGGGALFLLGVGRTVDTGPPAPATAAVDAAATDHLLWELLVAAAVILAATRLAGLACRRFGQPQVSGEILAGILLGPSLLGAVAPGASGALFPHDVLASIGSISELGLVLFMFIVGLELDGRHLRGLGHVVVTVSHVSIVAPFLLALAVAPVLYGRLAPPGTAFVPFALFLGASLSITAFPVLARILAERGLAGTPLGDVALSCAAVDDVSAWCLLAVVVAVTGSSGLAPAALTVALALAFCAAMFILVRPLLERFAAREESGDGRGGTALGVMLVGAFASAVATDRIGVHAAFGAFLFGMLTPAGSALAGRVRTSLEDVTVVLLLPLFLAHTGMRTSVGLLGSDVGLWALCGLIIALAVVGKWGGTTLAARALGMPSHEARTLGVLMNVRGLTELVILHVGLDLGVISPTLFTMLVLMALVTTFMAVPALSLLGRIRTSATPLSSGQATRRSS